ncbi:hypothetical protein SAMN06265222_12237 [Neorhodopirellula lusitana]|uniref:Uncharacterized protein n=1 Tax=Neorhodopirellula lusitana TaxID=445327 RepID=A0ABY1QT06_9BACT|nr:hypothetical protein [Neorhodopirellula lusitana]SMP76908.1 hypothetical protein SAMN06265222_12237 [Neorhodopirellula lusitana]
MSKAKSAVNRSPFWVILISTCVLALVLFGIIRTTGYVEGEEFSPTHFRSRKFTFYEIPLIHLQITPIRRTTTTPLTALMLTQKNWIKQPDLEPSTWHLVSLQRGNEDPVDDDAALLMKQLRLHRDGAPFWKTWSTDHPEMAQPFWQTIGTLSQRELYLVMPRLFEIVGPLDDPDTLKTMISDYLQTEYTSLIRDMRAAGRDELADALAKEAASDVDSPN